MPLLPTFPLRGQRERIRVQHTHTHGYPPAITSCRGPLYRNQLPQLKFLGQHKNSCQRGITSMLRLSIYVYVLKWFARS